MGQANAIQKTARYTCACVCLGPGRPAALVVVFPAAPAPPMGFRGVAFRERQARDPGSWPHLSIQRRCSLLSAHSMSSSSGCGNSRQERKPNQKS